MKYKIKITDASGLFSFRFLDSLLNKVYYVNGDSVDVNGLAFQAKFKSDTVISTKTAYLYVYDNYNNLLKTITVNSDTTDTANTFTINVTELLLSYTFQEDTAFGTATTSITYTNLENDIIITNTAFNDYLFSVDNVVFHSDVLPISELGASGTKTLYIKRAKSIYGMSVSDISFTNGAITRTLTIASLLKSKANDIWRTPTLLNSWVSVSGDLTPIQHTIDRNNIVHIKGIVKDGTDVDIFRLPLIYRPDADNVFVTTDNGIIAIINISSSGYVSVGNITNNKNLSINISFKL